MLADIGTEKLLLRLDGEEKQDLIEDIKPIYAALKKHGNSRQLQAMEKLLGMSGQGSPRRMEVTSMAGQADSNSMAPTPVLTNETNSPQSSSPPSTHASAVEHQAGDGLKANSTHTVNGVAPHVEVNGA